MTHRDFRFSDERSCDVCRDRRGELSHDHRRQNGNEPWTSDLVAGWAEGGTAESGDRQDNGERGSTHPDHPCADPRSAFTLQRNDRSKAAHQNCVDRVVQALVERVRQYDLERRVSDVALIARRRNLSETLGKLPVQRVTSASLLGAAIGGGIESSDERVRAEIEDEGQGKA